MPLPSEQRVADKPEAIRQLLRRATRRRPLVWLVEDLEAGPDYWVDLLKFMAVEIGRELPCLVVATVEAEEALERLAKGQWSEALHLAGTLTKAGKAETLQLERVSQAEVARYIAPAEAKLAERLHTLAEGIPVMVESLWQEWLTYEAVAQDGQRQWVAASNEEGWVFGETREQAEKLLAGCLIEEGPYEQETVEWMLAYGAVEGYTFTAQGVARVMGLDSDEVQDFWDDYLLETEEVYGLLVEAGFRRVTDGSGGRTLNLYRFAAPYLWQVWLKYPYLTDRERGEAQRAVAEALEVVYHPDSDQVGATLIRLFEATGQSQRAAPYRQRWQRTVELEMLRWQVALVADIASNPFEQYRLFELRLELSWRLYEAGRGEEGYLEAAQALAMAQGWGDQEREARALNFAGMNLQQSGHYEAARPCCERALAIREQVLGPPHPGTAYSLNRLAVLLKTQGDYEGARPYYERALAIREQVLGSTHPDTASSLSGLGSLLQAMGDNAGARSYLERALAICEQVLGPEHSSSRGVRGYLASLDQGPA